MYIPWYVHRYYAVNLRKSQKLLGEAPNDTGFLLDIGHGFTSCAAFRLNQPDDATPKSIEILSEISTDCGYVLGHSLTLFVGATDRQHCLLYTSDAADE